MSKKDRRWNPGVRPVERVNLSTKNVTLRAIAVGVLIVIAAVSIAAGVDSLLDKEPGWQEIEVISDTVNCSEDFKFTYDFTDYGGNATAAYKQIENLYTKAVEDCYRVFSADFVEEKLYNVAYLNSHANEIITVDPMLYDALELVKTYENRNIYLANVYVEYDRIFFADNAVDAAQYDPVKNPELLPFIQELASYANDPAMIDLELLGNDRVQLKVSDAYLTLAEEYEITEFVDFGWMTNAFICDYIADLMVENGFVHGNLVSYDGFTRNLDDRGESYSYNLFDREENAVNLPARMQYNEPMSLVFLRDYPMGDRDYMHYREYDDGSITSILVDPADGMQKAAIHNLVAYSTEEGCAEILMRIAPVFIADNWDASKVEAMAEDGIFAIWFANQTMHHTEPTAKIEAVTNDQ